ncbi:MAG: ribose-5-phosphate isomerase RpiA [Actinobacteria bacterium]|nr:ribose-5-phosphate isomerase RpiA [Actinomycetota bacterium]
MDAQDRMKQEVGRVSAAMIESGMVVGLGSGSTAAYMVEELGRRFQAGEVTDIVGVPTSFQSQVLADKYGIPLSSLNEVDHIDLGIDGADEVDPDKNLTKGGGACQTREKLVDSRCDQLIIIVDDGKLVDHLGQHMPLPVEVVPEAYVQVMEQLKGLGARPELRMAVRKAGPVVTDQGFLIIDASFGRIDDPAKLEQTINNIPGVLENGLFVDMVDQVIVGHVNGDDVSVTKM